MSDLSLPIVTTPLVDGSAPVGDLVSRNLYKATTSPSSLEVINGRLDVANLALPAGGLPSDVIRKGAYSRAGAVGQTLNLDYHELGSESQGSGTTYKIPGASSTFYIPHDAGKVLFMWQVSYASDRIIVPSDATAQPTVLLFHLDGELATEAVGGTPVTPSYIREAAGTTMRTVHPYLQYGIRRENRDRIWSGHLLCELDKGWHSAGLAVKSNANMTRIRTRNFKWIWFR